MALVRWPTDAPGKAPSHTKSWAAHQQSMASGIKGDGVVGINGKAVTPEQWRSGELLDALLGKVKPPEPPAAVETAPPPVEPGLLPLPVDASYDNDIEGYRRTRDDTQAGLTGDRTRGLLDYGFNEDPTTKALAFDPNNPFSRASLLKKQYDIGRASTGQQMSSGGQLYAGAYQTAQDSINRGQLGAEDTLQKSLTGFLAGNSSARTRADNQFEFDSVGAEGRRTGRAGDNPLYSPTAATSALAPPKPKPAAAVPKPKPIPALRGNTLTAAPGLKGVKKTRKGNTVTYTARVKGP